MLYCRRTTGWEKVVSIMGGWVCRLIFNGRDDKGFLIDTRWREAIKLVERNCQKC